ncbi:MAG: sugar-binding protein [Candidatus Aenigmatarchaeota archaeon]
MKKFLILYIYLIHLLSARVILLSHFNDGIYGLDKDGKKVEFISVEGRITKNKEGFQFTNSIPSSECLDLTGNIGCVRIPVEGYFNLNEGTVMFWVKTTWAGTDRLGYYTFFKLWHDWKHRFMIMKSEKSTNIYFYVSNPNFVEGEWGIKKDISDWQPGEWHHIVVTYFYSRPESQTGTGCLYIDGKLIVKSNHLKRILALPQYIELGFDNKYYSPKAYFDELVIFDRALNEREIENIYKMMVEEKKEISLDIDKEEKRSELSVPKIEIKDEEIKTLKIPKIPKGSIIIDGNLNEECWKSSVLVKDFYLYGKKDRKPKVETKSYLLYDDDYLYIGFICDEPNMDKITANVKEKDGPVWTDDCIEILIDPDKNPQNFWHIIINTLNILYDAKTSDTKFNIKGLLSGVKKGNNFWSIEVAIPFLEISNKKPVFGDKWGIKLCRERKTEVENLAFPYQGKPFNTYTGFADFTFGEEISKGDIKVNIKGDKPTLGWNEIKIFLEEQKGENRELILKIFRNTFSQKNILINEKRFVLKPKEKKEVNLEIQLKDIDTSDVLISLEEKEKVFYYQKLEIDGKDFLQKINKDIKEIKKIDIFLGDKEGTIYAELKSVCEKFKKDMNINLKMIDDSINKKVKISDDFMKNVKAIHEDFEKIKKIYSFIVWIPEDIWERFYPDSLPKTISDTPLLKISLAKNEYESSAIGISNLINDEIKVRVIVEDLKNEKGDILDSKNVIVRELIWIRDMNKELRDDPLISNDLNLFDIPLGKTKIIWLTFYSPENISSGIYKGKIILKPVDILREDFKKEIPIEVKIRNFVLPKENPINVFFWHSGYTPQPMEFLISSVKNRAEHRINWIMCETWWARGKKYDFSIWEKFFEECKKNKVKIMFGYGVNDVNFVEKVIPYFEKYGFKEDEYAFQFFADEFGEDRLEKAIEFGRDVKSKFPQTKWMMDIANVHWKGEKFKLLEKLFPYVDIIINSFSRVYPPNNPHAKFEIEFLKNNKKEFWTYKCSTKMIVQPLIEYYRLTPWQNWHVKSDGFAYWTYACFLGDPFDMFDITDKGYGWDEGIVYYGYGKDKGIVIDSKRYEALREGIEDYCYLYLLNKKIEEKKKTGINVKNEEEILNRGVEEVLKEKTSYVIYKWRQTIGDLIEKF